MKAKNKIRPGTTGAIEVLKKAACDAPPEGRGGHGATGETYLERAGHMSQEALQARIEADAGKFKEFKAEGGYIEAHTVRAANVGRELGLSFAEYYLPQDRAAAENYFNANYRKKLELTFTVFNWLIAAAKKLPEKCKSMEDVYPALQQMFLSSELIAPPQGRVLEQQAHETTPAQTFFVHLTKTRVELNKAIERSDKWDPATRADVRKTLEEHKKWIVAIEDKI